MSDPEHVEISRDRFLEPLGLGSLAPLLSRPEDRSTVFELLCDQLTEVGALTELSATEAGAQGLPMRVAGSRFIVRLNLPTKEELAWLAVAIAAATHLHIPGAHTLLATPIVELKERFKTLRPRYGELSVVDALEEGEPTALGVASRLHGNPCRHPDSECQFMTAVDGAATCGISLSAVKETLGYLVDQRHILERKNAVEPIEFGIAF